MTRRALLFPLLLLAFPVFTAKGQGAFSSQSWTMCTTTSISSCGLFLIETDAVNSGSTRVGTSVTVSLTNLQGALPQDNTIFSFFTSVLFVGHFGGIGGTSAPQFITPVVPGVPAAPNSWAWQSGSVLDAYGASMSMLTLYSPSLVSTIAGCSFVDPYFGPDEPSVYTCGDAQAAVFSFSTPSLFDASQFESARLETQGMTATSTDIVNSVCSADADAALGAEAECDVLAHSIVYPPTIIDIVPEPATISLVALGLTLTVAVSTRRRRQSR